MSKEEIIKVINKYQGMLDSNAFVILNKCKKLKEDNTNEEEINKFDSIINDVKSSESVIIKSLNKYVSELEKTS